MNRSGDTAALAFRAVGARPESDALLAGDPAVLWAEFRVADAVVFDLDVSLEVLDAAGEVLYVRHLRQDGIDASWLPTGEYRAEWNTGALALAAGDYTARMTLWSGGFGDPRAEDQTLFRFRVSGAAQGGPEGQWRIEAARGAPDLDQLSWRKGPEDWFYRHFDHAARTIMSYMLGDSPLLKGRVLDVGCGDGITDLGIFLRCRPERLVGIDPFSGFDRLPEILEANHLPLKDLPEGLEFRAADGNHIPFEDDSFDVVLSWGSLEHIAGGYHQTLLEIKRVLRDGGLLFAHPGLYYSNFGHHLGEFSDEPFFHLTRSEEQLKELVLNTPPDYIDRAGEFAPPEQYWQWYKELNPITVAGFERELKALDFDFYRVALRTEGLIEYHHPALQAYGMQDLATVELYLSAWNRKQPRPEGFQKEVLP